jgi:hypothetical protein
MVGTPALKQGSTPSVSPTGACRGGHPLETPAWEPFTGLWLLLYHLKPTRSPTINLNGALASMKRGTSEERALLRQAFDLLLELRTRPQAHKLLAQAVIYLRLLERQGELRDLPLVITVQVTRLRSP